MKLVCNFSDFRIWANIDSWYFFDFGMTCHTRVIGEWWAKSRRICYVRTLLCMVFGADCSSAKSAVIQLGKPICNWMTTSYISFLSTLFINFWWFLCCCKIRWLYKLKKGNVIVLVKNNYYWIVATCIRRC